MAPLVDDPTLGWSWDDRPDRSADVLVIYWPGIWILVRMLMVSILTRSRPDGVEL
jgi:hypothetical protein